MIGVVVLMSYNQGLEKILASSIIFVGSLVGSANAGEIKIINWSNQVIGSSMYTKHIEGSLEGLDGSDAIYNGGNPNTLHIYSNNPLCNPNKLMLDARGPNSTTIFNIELYNKDFVSSADNFLRFNIKNNSNFEWKNILLCLKKY